MMRKLGTVLLLLATWPLLTAGGGNNPPTDTPTKITGPAISAVAVVDTHNQQCDTTSGFCARHASLRLQKGTTSSGTVFSIPDTVAFNFGCQLVITAAMGFDQSLTGSSLTDLRFLGKLTRWVPQATINQLFSALGITVTPGTFDPVITDINNDVCTPSSSSPPPLDAPGVLSFTATIQFQVPH